MAVIDGEGDEDSIVKRSLAETGKPRCLEFAAEGLESLQGKDKDFLPFSQLFLISHGGVIKLVQFLEERTKKRRKDPLINRFLRPTVRG
jgi:hypothetical protein